jgi:hypothetical protein
MTKETPQPATTGGFTVQVVFCTAPGRSVNKPEEREEDVRALKRGDPVTITLKCRVKFIAFTDDQKHCRLDLEVQDAVNQWRKHK